MPRALRAHHDVRARAVRVVVRAIFSIYHRNVVVGARNIPVDGPFIIAANHLSFLDHVAISAYAARPVYFLGKAERLDRTGPLGRLSAAFFRAIHIVPVERDGGPGGVAALEQTATMLREGLGCGIHVEGTRSPDGRLYKARTGVAWLALETGAPVIPCGLVGTDRAQPPGARWIYPRPYEVHFGAPVPVADIAGQGSGDARARREVADRVTQYIQQLTGQEYVNSYAPRGKALAQGVGTRA